MLASTRQPFRILQEEAEIPECGDEEEALLHVRPSNRISHAHLRFVTES
jgi:hypothetical protein